MLVRCPTVLQADVSLPLNVRSEIEVERDVDLVSAIYVYPADELVDDHDPRSNVYLAQPGSSKELFYVNDKLVLNPIELKAMDQLSIGDTKLMFVPLCSEKFHW